MRRRMTRQMILLALAAMLLPWALLFPRLHEGFARQAFAGLRETAAALSVALDAAGDKAEALALAQPRMPGLRLTWMDDTGAVRYDSRADFSALENHADREEMVEAMEGGEGQSSRQSTTLGETTYYYARRLEDGSVLRLSQSGRSTLGELTALWPLALLVGLMVMGLATVSADRLGALILRPLGRLDLDHPLDNDAYEELSPMLARLESQRARILAQQAALAKHALALETITDRMAEGLVVLADDGTVLSMNLTARRLFRQADGQSGRRHYLALCRALSLQTAVEQALGGTTAEARLSLEDRVWQLLASPARAADETGGVILLLLDITEREQAEEARRAFTANVSHELKTPLTTIAGYAEMLETGLAPAEDAPALAQKITREARRLLALIQDILALSRLDEGHLPQARGPVDLLDMSRAVLENLAPAAAQASVTLSLEGGPATVQGARPLLEEMVFNLVDNGIKYNRPGGRVTVRVTGEAGGVSLAVVDTGVGIAPAHQARVFERFYRVDKSHARATGGTGLGLSIVKHGARVHGATVSLQSRPGEGTTVTLVFFERAIKNPHDF